MALTINLSANSNVLENHRNSEIGKYLSFGDILFYSKGLSNPTPYEQDKLLPLDKSLYKTPADFLAKLNSNLTNRTYGVFKHNTKVFYTVIPHASQYAKFEIKPANSASSDNLSVTDSIKKLGKTSGRNFFIAGAGPWFDGSDERKILGKLYMNNVLQSTASNSIAPFTSAAGHIQSNIQTTSNVQGYLTNEITIAQGEATICNDGFSGAPLLIKDSVAAMDFTTDNNKKEYIDGATRGRQIFAYIQSQDLIIHIIKEDSWFSGEFLSNKFQEFLLWQGCENAIFFDGSTSALLFEFNRIGGGQFLVNSIEDKTAWKKNGVFKYFYAIKKNYNA